MAFIMSAALGGAAKRASEIFEEERKEAISLIDSSLKDFGRLGVAKLSERKKKRKELDEAGQILKNAGFSDAQIAVAWQQNRHQQVVDHIIRQQALSKDNPEIAAFKPAEIITLAEGQDLSGMTYDQLLDGVMGKVSSGMTTADAIADIGGTGLQGAYMKQRADAAAAATGMNLAELRALATEDFEYGSPVQGAISLVDPVESARAATALSGKTTGQPGLEAAKTSLFNFGADMVGAKENVTSSGIVYTFEQPERRKALKSKISSMTRARGKTQFDQEEMDDMMIELEQWAVDNGYYVRPEVVTENGEETGSLPQLQGTDADTMFREALNLLPTVEADKQSDFLDSAWNQVYEYYKGKEFDNQRAREKADAWLKRVREEIKRTSQSSETVEEITDVPEGLSALVGAGQ